MLFYFIIIYKNPKKLRKNLKIQKYIFLESTASFHQNRVHRVKPCRPGIKMSFRPFRFKTIIFGQNRVHPVNTGQTMLTGIKNEFQAISGQNRHFLSKPSPPGQYESNHVDRDKK
jgi:hypothetical protein